MMLLVSSMIFMLGMSKTKSKGIYFLQFVFMWIVLAFCNDYSRVDYQNYVRKYMSLGESALEFLNIEIGYSITNKFFYQMGLSFEIANMIYAAIPLVIIAFIVPKYTKHYNLPASLYMIFPLLLNGIQIRNSLSAAIVILGMQYLFEEKKGNTKKYIICVFIAMLFHVTAIFYLCFVLVKFFDEKKLIFISGIFAVTSIFLIEVFSPILRILVGVNRFDSKFGSRNTLIECMIAAAWILLMVMLIYVVYKDLLKYSLEKEKQEFCKAVLRVNILSLTLIPLFYLDYSFERLFRNFIVYNYCIFSMYFHDEVIKIRTRKKFICFLGLMLWLVYSVVIFEGVLGDRINIIVRMYLTNNSIFLEPEKYWAFIFIILLIGIVLLVADMKKIVFCMKKIRFRRR